ncbi:MAG: hypothetical protein F4Z31_04440 [Gemmatimonadetes bacterium]|nr:hypothetical protein [Gemmatimonadota bacterium]MYJ10495.1 hypothetical protein [Gemmatimonadota bacterium]
MNLPDAIKHLGEAYNEFNDAVQKFETAASELHADPKVADAWDKAKEGLAELGQAVANVRVAISDL